MFKILSSIFCVIDCCPIYSWLAVITFIVFVGTLLWTNRYGQTKDSISSCPLPPGTMGWPVIGETVQFLLNKSKFYDEKRKLYGCIYKTHILGQPTIRVCGSDLIKKLMSRETENLEVAWPSSTKFAFGPTSMAQLPDREEHKLLKLKLLTAFSPTRIQDYMSCVHRLIKEHLENWTKQGNVMGFNACEALTSDIIIELALGCSKDNDSDHIVRDAFRIISQNIFTLPIDLPGFGFRKMKNARKNIEDFLKKTLDAQSDSAHVSIMEHFLSGHGKINEDTLSKTQIIDNGMMLLLAGSGTTAGAMSTLLLELFKHSEILDKLRQELNEHGLLNREESPDLTPDILSKLTYLRCIEKEILRFHQPVGGFFRRATKNLEIGGYRIPKSWTVILSIRDTHRMSQLFEEADKFIPERWLNQELAEAVRSHGQFDYLPFGHGVRSCLGKTLAQLTLRVYLVELCRLSTTTRWTIDNPDIHTVYFPVTYPADGLPLSFSPK